MSVFTNEYPYTDFHELNLDWLLKNYKEIVDSINTINSWIAQHTIDYNEAIARLTAVENEIDDFEARIEREFSLLEQQQQAQLDAAITAMNQTVDAKIRQLQNDVQTAINDMITQVEQLKIEVVNELTRFKQQINSEIIQIRAMVGANNDLIFDWVENRLQEFIDSLPEILTVQVYNPYRGEVTDIQTAIDDLYTIACIWGLTALQYDDIGLTASEYDAKELTAAEYDTMGYKLLYPDEAAYMISPFTGELTLIKDVVIRLAYFHMEGLTAEEYDNKKLTADEYDALQLTAFDYDWFGEILIA